MKIRFIYTAICFLLIFKNAYATGKDGLTLYAEGAYGTHTHLIVDGNLIVAGEEGSNSSLSFASQSRLRDTNVISVTAGMNHSLYLKSDGSLWAVGRNESGQLMDGTFLDRKNPVKIGDNVKSVSANGHSTVVVLNDGSLRGAGLIFGQVSASGERIAPTLSTSIIIERTGVEAAVLSDGFGIGEFCLIFLKSDGSLWRTTSASLRMPEYVDHEQIDPGPVIAFDSDRLHALFVRNDESLWAVGSNRRGQLGDGTFNDRNTPVRIIDRGVTYVATVSEASYFVKNDGSLWGMGHKDQLSVGSEDSLFPIRIKMNEADYYSGNILVNDNDPVEDIIEVYQGKGSQANIVLRSNGLFGYFSTSWNINEESKEWRPRIGEAKLVSGINIPLNANWFKSEWFGYFYQSGENDQRGWIFHQLLGWIYVYHKNDESIWLYHNEDSNWFWTNKKVYPHLYSNNHKRWAYLHQQMPTLIKYH